MTPLLLLTLIIAVVGFGVGACAGLESVANELRRLNELLHCENAIAIPDILRSIAKNTHPRTVARTKPKAAR